MQNKSKASVENIDYEKMSKWFFQFSEQAIESDIYHFLSKKIALDKDLLSLAFTANLSQPVPNLFFAAVNFLLYRNPSHSLINFYPNHSGNKFSQNGAFECFKLFCLNHSEQITQIMIRKLVQTNEVKRCALLMPAVLEVAKANSSALALVDVGASTGLNLLMDQYFYQYTDGPTVGDGKSKLKIECALKSGSLDLTFIPQIKERIGIDLNPIDLNDENEELWVLSLVWPDQLDRVERLKSAIQILKDKPVKFIKGDAVYKLKSVASELSPNLSLCIMHSFTLNQFTVEAREAFENTLCEFSVHRDVWRISLEWIGTELPHLNLDHYSSGQLLKRKSLAVCHQHGEWIRWLNV